MIFEDGEKVSECRIKEDNIIRIQARMKAGM